MFPKKLTKQVICEYDRPIVQTKEGKLRGLIVEDAYIFRGIRYAEAKRYHMPERVKPWEGVKDAIVFGAVCPEITTVIPHDEYNVPHFFYPQDEACQYLNIWTQSIDEGVKKPVIVWIHGGGYATGSSVELYAYDGEELSKYGDVVVVSINHRLNVLGYLDLSGYGDQYKYTGNLGMADIVAALEWVKDNIGAFGGDPGCVTIMGQSGGGGKVRTLLQMPAADGLYHRAVVQSGTFGDGSDITTELGRKMAQKVTRNLGLTAETIGEIESVPYYRLARAADSAAAEFIAETGIFMPWAPVFDGEYYMGDPRKNGFRKENHSIPLLIGTVLGEFFGNYNIVLAPGSKNDWDDETVDRLMKEYYGEAAQKVAVEFKKAYPDKKPADALFVDKFFRKPTLDYVRARVKTKDCAPTYSYMFTLELPLNSGTTAWHNVEEAYMFHNAEYLEASYIPGVSEKLQDIMTGAWLAFAKTGNPNHAGMPEWEPVPVDRASLIIFDEEIKMAYEHDTALLDAIPSKPLNLGGHRAAKKALGGGPRQSI